MNGRNIAAISALTPSQEGILFHVIRDGARGAYHSQFSARIEGALDVARWQRAWEQVVARHDALRALFTWEGRDKPLQIIRERADLPWQTLDWRDLADESAQDAALTDWLARDRDLGFTLDRAPLFRCALIALNDNQHRFVLSFHHLIMDGWSMRLAFNEARALYADGAALRDSAPSFTAFVEWLNRRDDAADQAFWSSELGDFDAPVFPDVAGSESAAPAATHELVERTLDAADVAALGTLARELRVTMSSVVSAAYALLLRLYTDRDDLVFGTTVAGRPPELPDVEHTVGLFINTLPLRVSADGHDDVAAFVRAVHQKQVALRSREQSSAALAQRQSAVAPGTPLFESILVYENFPAAPDAVDGPDCTIDRFVEFSHFPLAILAVPDEAFQLIAISDPARLDRPALEQLLDNLCQILHALPAAKNASLDALPALAPAQRTQVVDTFNKTAVALETAQTLWSQFLAQADRTPNVAALSDTVRTVSYAQLKSQAAQVAATLRAAGVRAEDVVLVLGARDSTTVASVFGVLGAGAAYCPVAEDATAARLKALVQELQRDDRRVFALATPDALTRLPEQVTALALRWHDAPSAPPPEGPALDDTAYVMFTSGSTGTPKGVVVSHANLCHSVHARDHYYDSAPDAFLLLSTLPTDSAMAGLFWTLARGGTLVLPADRAEQDIASLISTIDNQRVTHLLTVPSLYAVLLEELSDTGALQCAIVAGEACPDELVTRHHNQLPGVALHNEYGPTETTVWCSAAELAASRPVRIGTPLANTRIYVVNRYGQPLPPGVAGELVVGGPQVAQRYAGDPQRTADRFVASPFLDGDRLYRTGDRARWHRDGSLSFVGRVDDQIKVRGFRVEPGEIEAILRAHDGVDNAVVVLHDGSGGTPRLVGWLLAEPTLALDDVRAAAAATLPAHMVPQHLERVDDLPRTAAGKIDRRALAARPMTAPGAAANEVVPPSNDTEASLAAIWCDVLGVERVGIHDDFFALGGDSLLSIRVLARAGKAGLALSPTDFFAHPTVAGQAAAAGQSPERTIDQKPVIGPQPLMPIQRWFFDHISAGTAQWNLSYRFDLAPTASLADTRRAVTAVVAHHDALRSVFTSDGGTWSARQVAPTDVDIVEEITLDLAEGDIDAQIAKHADALNRSLDLSDAPLMRVALVRTPGEQPDALVVLVHHLVVDAESWRIVIEDLAEVLDQLDRGEAPALPPKTHALRDWAKRLNAWPQEPDFAERERAWSAALARPYADLTADDATGHTEGQTHTRELRLDAPATASLPHAASQHRASVYELLVAGVARALGRQLDANAVRFELEGHGRDPVFDDLDVSRTVGWFTTAYPLVARDDTRFASAAAALRSVKTAMRALPDNGVSYGALMAANVGTLPAAGRSTVLFNFLGESGGRDDGRLRLRDERCGEARSPDAPRAYALEINAQIDAAELVMTLAWPRRALSDATVDGLGATLLDTLRALLGEQESTAVPEDFPLANLTSEGLSDLSDLLDELDDD